jgi:hypothetical protein
MRDNHGQSPGGGGQKALFCYQVHRLRPLVLLLGVP